MAKNTIKITTKVTGMKDVQKALLEIEKQFNMLVSQIHSPAEKALPETSGRTGDIQIVENVDKSYTFELKTNKGWRIPYIGDSPIVFKSKDKVNTVKKSIDEIEADDTNSGGRLAKTTIYDEKNDKFVMPRADYDSGWWTWDWSDAELLVDNPYVLTHNLGVIPTQYMILFAPDGSITGGTAMEASRANPTISGAHGSVVDTSIIKWAIPLPPYGYMRVLLWK